MIKVKAAHLHALLPPPNIHTRQLSTVAGQHGPWACVRPRAADPRAPARAHATAWLHRVAARRALAPRRSWRAIAAWAHTTTAGCVWDGCYVCDACLSYMCRLWWDALFLCVSLCLRSFHPSFLIFTPISSSSLPIICSFVDCMGCVVGIVRGAGRQRDPLTHLQLWLRRHRVCRQQQRDGHIPCHRGVLP